MTGTENIEIEHKVKFGKHACTNFRTSRKLLRLACSQQFVFKLALREISSKRNCSTLTTGLQTN